MAARAGRLHDTGESAPQNWEPPFGSPDVNVALTVMAPDQDRLDALLRRSAALAEQLPGVQVIYQMDSRSSDGREAFGFRDNISHPVIERSGLPSTNSAEEPIKAGEFILGYADETGRIPPMPSPDVLGRNGSFLVIRKLEQRVAEFRQYLRDNSAGPAAEELLAAKTMGRWRSGAPLVLAPEHDDPALGADPQQDNDFGYNSGDDQRGFMCPPDLISGG